MKIRTHSLWLLLLLGYSGGIYWQSSMPMLLPLPDIIQADKLIHATAYGVMAYIAFQYILSYGFKLFHVFLLSLLYASLYGMSDEWHQSFVVGRDASVWDWVADSVGALIVSSVCYYRIKWKNLHD